ncbi:MAG: hypothetical protein IJX98_07085 [Clostridia bacterium]|nr:hypothetical protein [Clostridia bacterium]
MEFTISCPECGEEITVNEQTAKKLQACPSCGFCLREENESDSAGEISSDGQQVHEQEQRRAVRQSKKERKQRKKQEERRKKEWKEKLLWLPAVFSGLFFAVGFVFAAIMGNKILDGYAWIVFVSYLVSLCGWLATGMIKGWKKFVIVFAGITLACFLVSWVYITVGKKPEETPNFSETEIEQTTATFL